MDAKSARAVLLYTVLRIALFAAIWGIVYFVTPLGALWSAVAAILMSGAVSLILLDRQRGAAATVAGRFFGRINDRIEASARAEDVDDEPDQAVPPSGESDEGTKDDAVGEQQ